MTRLKQFSNEFDIHYSRENRPRIGGVQCPASSEAGFRRNWGQEQTLPSTGRGNKETGQDWLAVWGFLTGSAGPIFGGQGKLATAELEDFDWCLLGFLHR